MSELLCPVRSMINCSTLASKSFVAAVARKEWFVRNPGIPAVLQNCATVPWRRL